MKEAKDLPDTDNFAFNISRGDLTDPFVTIFLDQVSSLPDKARVLHASETQVELLKTAFMENCLNPEWDEEYTVPVCHPASELRVKVMDREHIGHEEVGHFIIKTDDIIGGEPMDDWFPLTLKNGDVQGEVHIALQFIPLGTNDTGKGLVDGYFKVGHFHS